MMRRALLRHLLLPVSFVLSVALSCDGGKLDAFVGVDASISGNAGNGGTTPTGGSGGTSGMVAGGEGGGEGVLDLLLIDDFEDGDGFALIEQAPWYVSNNATGVQNLEFVAPLLERPGSAVSLHTSGVSFEYIGASLVLGIAGEAATYDASAYGALRFSARAEAGSSATVLVAFLVGSQHFAVPMRFGTDWGVHTIAFRDAIPVQSGPEASVDPRRLAAIQFITPKDVSFDFWLDDLAFVK
jgi:hypothetical protein